MAYHDSIGEGFTRAGEDGQKDLPKNTRESMEQPSLALDQVTTGHQSLAVHSLPQQVEAPVLFISSSPQHELVVFNPS